ncbi:MmoB/DmpM family protein [Mycobacterium sp. UM_Kg1]|uniref:MmoB/DmpM family protein n=1 Tax=Mycobacterium sp. UM_Kg1 TaxID=1545691 RepID=UPI0009E30BC0|nr:MmoB/DmpM family protein [Mycobacterium sp. UM_Kg1]
MARTTARPAARGVGASLIKGPETDAIARYLRRTQPTVNVTDRGVYLKVDAPDEIIIDLAELSTEVGRPLELEDVLIVLASYFGEIDPQRGARPGTGRLVLRADSLSDRSQDDEGIR